jgi:hypothetical protein
MKGMRFKGFSILELLIVGVLFALVMGITSALYFRGRDAMQLSTDKIDTSGRSRRVMDTLTPLVASAIETGGFEGLEVHDITPEVLTDECHLDVTSRENFLDKNYTPSADFDVMGPYYRYRVAFEPDTNELKLYSLKIVPVEIDDTVAGKLLARNVMGCRFEPVTVGSVAVTLEVKADREDSRRPGGVTTTRLNAILVSPGSQ